MQTSMNKPEYVLFLPTLGPNVSVCVLALQILKEQFVIFEPSAACSENCYCYGCQAAAKLYMHLGGGNIYIIFDKCMIVT